MLVSMVSPSITRITSTNGQSGQETTVTGALESVAGSDAVAGTIELLLEQAAASRTANIVTTRGKRMCHRVDPETVHYFFKQAIA